MIVSLRPLRRVSLRAKRSNLFKEIASPFGLAMTLVVATPVILRPKAMWSALTARL